MIREKTIIVVRWTLTPPSQPSLFTCARDNGGPKNIHQSEADASH